MRINPNNTVTSITAFTTVTAIITIMLAVLSCGTSRRVSYLTQNNVSADLSIPSDRVTDLPDTVRAVHRDTLTVTDPEGHEVIIMNAIKDENGEMVAHDVLEAAVVTARFRNVAERHGKVDLHFDITVPPSMQNSTWQLRLHPDLFVMEDSLRLESVVITGDSYRRAQIRGYQQYEKYLASIVQDTARFINLRQLEIFIQRNIPALYAFKTDSSVVSDEHFHSVFGVSEQEAVEHYTDKLARSINRWRRSRIGLKYDKYVKVPIVTDGIRLDSVIRADGGEIIYCYTQTINTRPRLRKADVVLSGEIYESSRRIYTVPRSEPLTFYISSLSAFVDGTEHYMTQVIERRVQANTACYIDFEQGSSEIREDLGCNADEMGRIRSNLKDLVLNEKYDLDSITITAFASPEGTVRFNDRLCRARAASASDYFSRYIRLVRDSVRTERGIVIDLSGESQLRMPSSDIRFVSRSGGENWPLLMTLCASDEDISIEDKEQIESFIRSIQEEDDRERAVSSLSCYIHLRESLYPRLRIVKFDFFLHRRGMIKDTVHTTVLDSTYMEGVQAIRDREYEKAISLLRPYGDYNAAVAFTAMDYNESALNILRDLPSTGQTEYLKAILFSRKGEIEMAVQCFLNAVGFDRSYYNRGNLDPEIRELIRTYNLDRRDDEYDLNY